MNQRQKEVLKSQLNDEKKVINELKKVYKEALDDINQKVAVLMVDETMQSKIYQAGYQKNLKKQIEESLELLNSGQYEKIHDYLNACYSSGFVGAMYDIHGQGIPLIIPIDQKAMVKAVQTDSKISKGLYTKLGKDVDDLKKRITSEVSRGVAQALPYNDVARNLNNVANIGLNRSMRIARTEGHRITQASALDAMKSAKSVGADVLKQWDATLDGATRDTHRELDGKIVEIDEEFEYSGGTVEAPSMFGDPAEDCNCRCCLLQRARWELDESELDTLKERADYFGLDKTKDFDDFKEKYLNISDKDLKNVEHSESYGNIMARIEQDPVEYNEAKPLKHKLSDDEIIDKISGGDLTGGSCASVAYAYVGNKSGLDVTDFRGGNSRYHFASKFTSIDIANLNGVESQIVKVPIETKGTMKLLEGIPKGKEYVLGAGKHSAIVRKTDNGVLQYLELQSANENGFKDFQTDTLRNRFGCTKTKSKRGDSTITLVDVESLGKSDEFKELLGYINTSGLQQNKGVKGHEK